jgi:hypothetical protein
MTRLGGGRDLEPRFFGFVVMPLKNPERPNTSRQFHETSLTLSANARDDYISFG